LDEARGLIFGTFAFGELAAAEVDGQVLGKPYG
jgi:hypothetical protein